MRVVTALMDSLAGLTLIVAGIAKLGSMRLFGDQIAAYNVIPLAVTKPLGYLLPPLEVAIGITAIAFSSLAFAAAFCFVSFAAAIGINLLRGKRELRCGCFGASSTHRISFSHVIINLLLAAGALAAWRYHPHVSVLGIEGGTAIVMIYGLLSASRVMRNAHPSAER